MGLSPKVKLSLRLPNFGRSGAEVPRRPLLVRDSQRVLLTGLAALASATDPADIASQGLAQAAALALGEVTGVGGGPAAEAARPLLSLMHEIEDGRLTASPSLRAVLHQAVEALDPPGPAEEPTLIHEYLWEAERAQVRTHLVRDWASYREARVHLLNSLNLHLSNRDPMSEFSEALVRVLYKGNLAPSRVQQGWDVVSALKGRIQVKYLANPSGAWVNESLVLHSPEIDDSALVIFIDLMPESVLVFPAQRLEAIGALLGTRHPEQDTPLEFTQGNYEFIRSDPGRFVSLGLDVWLRTGPNDWCLVPSDGARSPWPRAGNGPVPAS